MPSLKLDDLLGVPKLPAYLETINRYMEQAVQSANPGLRRPLLNVVGAKSKRLRSSLLFASTGGKLTKNITLAGSAIELLHLGSLVHDDLIDKADTRWGKPSLAATDGQAAAILAGDYLLASACATAAKIDSQAVELISHTIIGLIQGESLEAADDYNPCRTTKSYMDCIQAKTAGLISASCRLGGICAGLSNKQVNALALYGSHLGISFQLIDDLLDILSNSKLMGKPVGSDARNGVYTLPVIYSLHSGSQRKLKKLIKNPNHSTKELAQLLISDGSIQKTISQVNKYNLAAQNSLAGLNGPSITDLQNLPSAYLNWTLNNLVQEDYKTQTIDPK